MFFRHLLDGSRAANRLGWQWATGVGSAKHYGFSRWQVNKRAPGLCETCRHQAACPIEDWPADPSFSVSPVVNGDHRSTPRSDATAGIGPTTTQWRATPEQVWLTAESLGSADPALVAHPRLPTVFVFDSPLLARLRLNAKRLVFFVETLAEIAESRDLNLYLGDPVGVLGNGWPENLAVTFAPVPGFRFRAAQIRPSVVYPWPWLRQPIVSDGVPSVSSFSAWRKSLDRASIR